MSVMFFSCETLQVQIEKIGRQEQRRAAQGSADPVVKETAMNQSNLRHKKSIYGIFLNVQQVNLREQLIVDGAFISHGCTFDPSFMQVASRPPMRVK